jgi:hypothetical protein
MSNSRFGLRTRSGSISGIIGGNFGSTGFLLNDFPGVTFGVSLRKLKQDSNLSIRVRRSSDNTEQDIGFSGTNLDTSALLSFVGGGNGFISTWYDQSGNNFHFNQAAIASQPQIVNSGSVLTFNGKPYIFSDGINNILNTSSTFSYNNATMIIVAGQFGSGDTNYGRFIDNDFTNGFWFGRDLSNLAINGGFRQPSPPFGPSYPYPNDTQFLLFSYRNGASTVAHLNNSTANAVTTSPTTTAGGIVSIGGGNTNTFFGKKYHQEYIFYQSDKSLDRLEIQQQINSFYNTY